MKSECSPGRKYKIVTAFLFHSFHETVAPTAVHCFKARSHDPILRIRFKDPKIASRCSDGQISRLRFCGENIERSFVVCSRDPILRTNKESSIWRQNNHRETCKICRRLSSFKKSVG